MTSPDTPKNPEKKEGDITPFDIDCLDETKAFLQKIFGGFKPGSYPESERKKDRTRFKGRRLDGTRLMEEAIGKMTHKVKRKFKKTPLSKQFFEEAQELRQLSVDANLYHRQSDHSRNMAQIIDFGEDYKQKIEKCVVDFEQVIYEQQPPKKFELIEQFYLALLIALNFSAYKDKNGNMRQEGNHYFIGDYILHSLVQKMTLTYKQNGWLKKGGSQELIEIREILRLSESKDFNAEATLDSGAIPPKRQGRWHFLRSPELLAEAKRTLSDISGMLTLAIQALDSQEVASNIFSKESNEEDAKTDLEEWKVLGDIYHEDTSWERALPQVEKSLSGDGEGIICKNDEYTLTLDPSHSQFKGAYLASGHFIPTNKFKKIMESGNRDYFVNIKKHTKGFRVDPILGAFSFLVSKDGEILINFSNKEITKEALGEYQYQVIRAYILYYISQITTAEYEIATPSDIMSQMKGRVPSKPKPDPETDGVRTITLPRQNREISLVTKSTDKYSQAEGKVISYRDDNTRLLPHTWKPSKKQYELGQKSGLSLYAYLINTEQGTIERLQRIDIDERTDKKYSHKEFLELYNDLREKNETSPARKVRVQTFIQGFDIRGDVESVGGKVREIIDPKKGPRSSRSIPRYDENKNEEESQK